MRKYYVFFDKKAIILINLYIVLYTNMQNSIDF